MSTSAGGRTRTEAGLASSPDPEGQHDLCRAWNPDRLRRVWTFRLSNRRGLHRCLQLLCVRRSQSQVRQHPDRALAWIECQQEASRSAGSEFPSLTPWLPLGAALFFARHGHLRRRGLHDRNRTKVGLSRRSHVASIERSPPTFPITPMDPSVALTSPPIATPPPIAARYFELLPPSVLPLSVTQRSAPRSCEAAAARRRANFVLRVRRDVRRCLNRRWPRLDVWE